MRNSARRTVQEQCARGGGGMSGEQSRRNNVGGMQSLECRTFVGKYEECNKKQI